VIEEVCGADNCLIPAVSKIILRALDGALSRNVLERSGDSLERRKGVSQRRAGYHHDSSERTPEFEYQKNGAGG
jgi:hypothetical protein